MIFRIFWTPSYTPMFVWSSWAIYTIWLAKKSRCDIFIAVCPPFNFFLDPPLPTGYMPPLQGMRLSSMLAGHSPEPGMASANTFLRSSRGIDAGRRSRPCAPVFIFEFLVMVPTAMVEILVEVPAASSCSCSPGRRGRAPGRRLSPPSSARTSGCRQFV